MGELVEDLDAIRSRMSDRAVEMLGRMRAFDQVELEADPETPRERMRREWEEEEGGSDV